MLCAEFGNGSAGEGTQPAFYCTAILKVEACCPLLMCSK
jgi:hypothetical protein